MATNSYNCFIPNIGERMKVMVSHAEYNKDKQQFILWGQFRLAQVKQIEDALTELQDVAQRKEHPRGQLRLGDLCLAKSIQDNQWHRASIQTATGNDVLAFYVDYGSTEFVPRSRIRTLDETLSLDYEAQATKLSLRGIQPRFIRGGIKTGTLDYLDRYVVNKEFLCEPMEHCPDAVSVKLYSLTGKRDVSAQFIADDFAEPAMHQQVASPVPDLTEVDVTHLPVMGMDVGQRERVYVSNVATPNQFWLQQEVVAVDLDDMMTDLQSFFGPGRNAEPISHIAPNLPCVAKCPADDQFYRGQVVRSAGLQTCEVFFVDYGNTEVVKVSDIRALPDQFSKLPGAAIEAGLSGIDPASCSHDASITRFEALTIEKTLCVKADSIEGAKVMVSMVDPRSDMNLSIGEILIKERLATRTVARRPHGSPVDGYAPSSHSSSRASNASLPSPRGQTSLGKFKYPNLKVGSRYPVTVTDIKRSSDFACQLLAQSSEFEEMSGVLQEEYFSRGSKVKNLHAGSVCCAQFSEDDVWYRAEVRKVSEMSVDVYFVDYGNSDVLPLGRVKQLDASYMDLEVQSFRCQMEDIEEFPSSSDKMKAKFEELVGENELEVRICKVEGSVCIVELMDKATRVNVNAEMQQLCDTLKPRTTRGTRPSVSEEFVRVKLERHEKLKVYVSNVESPNLFHCQPVRSAQDLQTMMDELNEHIAHTASGSSFQPKLQAPCLAQYSDDQMWYRALVSGIKRSGDVEVRFVDFGNHETVKVSAIRPLPSNFMAFPMQGIPCSLEGVSLRSWEDDDVNKFSDMCGDTELEVDFGNRLGENYEVKLVTETALCINEVFQTPQHRVLSLRNSRPLPPGRGNHPSRQPSASASPRQISQFTERELKVGPAVDIYISHVENLFELWCQPASTTKDLESLMMKLGEKYSKLRPGQLAINNPRLGMACVAQFQEDKGWYRAIVTNKQLNRVYVCFVDYGNFEYVPVSCIKETDEEIMRVPVVAVKCSLRGAKELDGPARVKSLRNLIDQVDCFSCKVVSTANGVFEVDVTFGGGKSVVDILKKGPKEEEDSKPSNATIRQQTSPKGQRSGPPRSTKHPNTTFKGKSPPQPQRQFQPSPAVPTQDQQPSQSEDSWEIPALPASALPAPATPTPATPTPATHAPLTLKYVKRQAESVIPGEFIDIIVSFIESPARFWLQLASLCPEVDALMESMNDEVASGRLQPVTILENGQLCVARSSVDSALYRARVMKKLADQVEVHYIDYGNKEVVPLPSIFTISHALVKLPSQALECSLSGMSKTLPFTDDVVEKFTEVTMEKQLVAKPIRKCMNRLEVELSDTSGDEDVDISEVMVKAIGSGNMALLPPPAIPKDHTTVYVTQVQENGSFSIQLASATETLDQLHADLQAAYAEEVTALTDAKPGRLCCGVYSEDSEWYRGIVETTVQASGEASVRFIDYGNVSVCKVSELKELLPQFMEKPAVAINCELHDVYLTGIPDIGNALEVLTLEKELTCQFHDEQLPCQVSLSDVDVRINSELKKKFDYQPQMPAIAEPGTSWVYPTFEVGKKFEAYVSSVVSPGYFFCQPSNMTKALDDLMTEMQAVYSPAESLVNAGDVPNGTLCAALFEEDKQWYRAEIIQQEGQSVTVLFPDYGNADVVDKTNLRVLQKKHSDQTLKAICCSLEGILPSSGAWTSNANEYLETETIDKPLLVEVLKLPAESPRAGETLYRVNLLDMGVRVADKLIQAGHASGENDAVVLASGESSGPKVSSVQVFPGYPSLEFNDGSTENVFITAVTSLDDFCIQLARHSDRVTDITGRVDAFYKANDVPPIADAKVGTPCVAQFSEDQAWYRAVVCEVTGEDTYVTFVDYGNGDSPSPASIRELTEEFAEEPAYAVKCRLAGIDRAGQAADEAKVRKFEGVMEKEGLVAKVFGTRNGIVDVQILDEGVSVTAGLSLEEDLGQYRSATTDPPQATVTPERPISTTMYPGYTSQLISAGTLIPVFLTSMTSTSEFYVQLCSDSDAVAKLTAGVDEHYKNNDVPSLRAVEVGTVCAAQFSDDEVWYRAQVTSIGEDTADVIFVDYGNSDTAEMTNIKLLKDDFKTPSTFALRCRLLGVDDSAEDEATLDKFQDYLENDSLQAKVVDCNDGTTMTITLLDNGRSVAAALGLEETPSYATYDIPVGSSEPVYLTSVVALDDFAVQLKKFEDAVADYSARVDDFYKNNEVAPPTSVSTGVQCVANFSDDGAWYRGSVHHLEGTSAEVTFVDYGNSDLVETSQLKRLHPDFSVQHAYSFRCQLAGVSGRPASQEELVAKFEEYLENDNLVAKVIKIHEGKLVVQMLDGDTSVAVQLGITEDITAELTDGNNIITTAKSLVEDALSSAMKDIELESHPREVDMHPSEGEMHPKEEGESHPREEESNPREEETHPSEGEMHPREGESHPREGESHPSEGESQPMEGEDGSDSEDVAGHLIDEVVDIVCKEVIEDANGKRQNGEMSPSMVSPEISPPRVSTSPSDGSIQDEFEDAATSPERQEEKDVALGEVKEETELLSEEENYQDASEESQREEEEADGVSKNLENEQTEEGDREHENREMDETERPKDSAGEEDDSYDSNDEEGDELDEGGRGVVEEEGEDAVGSSEGGGQGEENGQSDDEDGDVPLNGDSENKDDTGSRDETARNGGSSTEEVEDKTQNDETVEAGDLPLECDSEDGQMKAIQQQQQQSGDKEKEDVIAS